MKRIFLTVLCLLWQASSYAADNLLLISLDGLRWQEVFSGADSDLIGNKDYVKNPETLKAEFWAENAQERRQKLMPFLWQTVATKGVLLGNRHNNSPMQVANPWFFSYPGYSEMLTGKVDPLINSNNKIPNPNVTFLEWANQQPEYKNRVAAFGSWDVFPYILNTGRSGLPVNAGFMPASHADLSGRELYLNELQSETPSPWENVRLDVFTYQYTREYIRAEQPRIIYVSLGETDDFAHDGNYAAYLRSAHRDDEFIGRLWNYLQTLDQYRDNTALLITTDHGRGQNADDWLHHASGRAIQGYLKSLTAYAKGIIGSDQVWFAAMGPGIRAAGELPLEKPAELQQVTATALQALGIRKNDFSKKAAPALQQIFEQEL